MKFLRLILIAVPLFVFTINTAAAYKYTPYKGYVVLVYSSANVTSCGQVATPPGYPGMYPPANTTSAYGLYGETSGWFSFTCSGFGGSATAWEYLDVGPRPSLAYFDAQGCIIPGGASDCNIHYWWGVANAYTPRTYVNWGIRKVWIFSFVTQDRLYTTASGDVYDNIRPGPGSHTIRISDVDGWLHAGKTVIKSCAPGSSWNGSICLPPTGTISATPQQCIIPVGSNTCSTSISYSTANTDGAQVLAGNTPFITGVSRSNVTYSSVPYGPLLFTLKNAGSDGDTRELARVTVSGTCGGDNEYNASKSLCVPPTPVIESNISPSSVPYNGPVAISWSIKYPNNSCKVQAVLQKPPTCNAACQADVASEQTLLNTTLSSGMTNQNDPNGRRTMSTALGTPASGVYAKGTKTVNMKYSAEFQFTCDTTGQPGAVSLPAKATKKMIYITTQNEG